MDSESLGSGSPSTYFVVPTWMRCVGGDMSVAAALARQFRAASR